MFWLVMVWSLLNSMQSPAWAQTTTSILRSNQTSNHWQLSDSWAFGAIHSQEVDVLSESARTQLEGSFILHRRFDRQLDLRFAPAFRFVTGRDQDVFSDRLPKDKIYAEEAKISWTPSAHLAIEAGALDQSQLENSLLVYSRPFPALRLRLGENDVAAEPLGFTAQFAIPSSYTLDTQVTAEESLPTLQTYSLTYHESPIRLGGTYYRFDNLPQVVAVTSKRLGNSVDLFSSATGRFHYAFQGLAALAQADAHLAAWTFEWQGRGIRNLEAPSNLGTGFTSTIKVTRPVSSQQTLGLSLSYYRVEPDTAPALYTDPIFANNRVGAGAEIFTDHRPWGLRFKLSYFQDTPYYQNNLMGKREMALVSVGSLGEESIFDF